VWNLRLAGVDEVEAADLSPWRRPDGPMVLPGRYRARLRAGALAESVDFEVLPDPRRPLDMEGLTAQLDFLIAVRDRLSLCNRTLNAVDRALARLRAPWQADAGAAERIAALEAARAELIDVRMRGAQLWPSGVHEKLNALFEAADSADGPPTGQEREVFAALSAVLDALIARCQALGAVVPAAG